MQALAQHCRGLQSLNLGWCEHITDKGVIALTQGCPDLRVVDLCGCSLITGLYHPQLFGWVAALKVALIQRLKSIPQVYIKCSQTCCNSHFQNPHSILERSCHCSPLMSILESIHLARFYLDLSLILAEGRRHGPKMGNNEMLTK